MSLTFYGTYHTILLQRYGKPVKSIIRIVAVYNLLQEQY